MSYRDIAPRLMERGWRSPIPLTSAKGTFAPWREVQHRDMTDVTLAFYVQKFGSAPRTGIVFGPQRGLVGIDVDVVEADANKAIRAIVARTLPRTEFVRFGKRPKFFLLYSGGVASRKPFGLGIEIFGSSGQFAAFGPHPTAGVDYEWPQRSPLDASPDDLPEITEAHVSAFLNAASVVLAPNRTANSFGRAEEDFFQLLRRERQLLGLEGARRQLAGATQGTRHVVLLSVIGYLVSKGYSTEQCAAFADEHFAVDARDTRGDFADVRGRAERLAIDSARKFSAIRARTAR